MESAVANEFIMHRSVEPSFPMSVRKISPTVPSSYIPAVMYPSYPPIESLCGRQRRQRIANPTRPPTRRPPKNPSLQVRAIGPRFGSKPYVSKAMKLWNWRLSGPWKSAEPVLSRSSSAQRSTSSSVFARVCVM
jgi:hypothetical protein